MVPAGELLGDGLVHGHDRRLEGQGDVEVVVYRASLQLDPFRLLEHSSLGCVEPDPEWGFQERRGHADAAVRAEFQPELTSHVRSCAGHQQRQPLLGVWVAQREVQVVGDAPEGLGVAVELPDGGPALEHEPGGGPDIVVGQERQVRIERGVSGHVSLAAAI